MRNRIIAGFSTTEPSQASRGASSGVVAAAAAEARSPSCSSGAPDPVGRRPPPCRAARPRPRSTEDLRVDGAVRPRRSAGRVVRSTNGPERRAAARQRDAARAVAGARHGVRRDEASPVADAAPPTAPRSPPRTRPPGRRRIVWPTRQRSAWRRSGTGLRGVARRARRSRCAGRSRSSPAGSARRRSWTRRRSGCRPARRSGPGSRREYGCPGHGTGRCRPGPAAPVAGRRRPARRPVTTQQRAAHRPTTRPLPPSHGRPPPGVPSGAHPEGRDVQLALGAARGGPAGTPVTSGSRCCRSPRRRRPAAAGRSRSRNGHRPARPGDPPAGRQQRLAERAGARTGRRTADRVAGGVGVVGVGAAGVEEVVAAR